MVGTELISGVDILSQLDCTVLANIQACQNIASLGWKKFGVIQPHILGVKPSSVPGKQ